MFYIHYCNDYDVNDVSWTENYTYEENWLSNWDDSPYDVLQTDGQHVWLAYDEEMGDLSIRLGGTRWHLPANVAFVDRGMALVAH